MWIRIRIRFRNTTLLFRVICTYCIPCLLSPFSNPLLPLCPCSLSIFHCSLSYVSLSVLLTFFLAPIANLLSLTSIQSLLLFSPMFRIRILRFVCFLAFWISIRIRKLFVWIRILPSTGKKKMKKNLDFYCFVTSL